MRFNKLKNIKDTEFRRLTGVKRNTFHKMVEIIKNTYAQRNKKKSGRPKKLSVEDELLMTLEYLREYRTLFHIGYSYGMSESSAQRTICGIEEILIKDGTFNLPKRKEIVLSDDPIEVILVDAAESPIERPKKKD
jgi:hypothetical protein